MENCKAIGIDLGTTYSCVAVYKNGRAELLSNNFQKRMTPSCVAYTVNGIRVGEAAKKYLTTDPSNTICAVKRIMGRQFNDQSAQNYIQHWPYKVIASNDNKPLIEVQLKRETKNVRPEEVSAEILRYMKQTAEKHLGHDVTNAVITVPANFTDAQRQATFNAARLAGLNVLRLMNEPTAAAVAYGYENIPTTQSNHNLLIFDLGGGTLDVSIVTIDKQHSFKVLATAGNSNLGGDDFDQRIRERFTKEFRRMSQSDVSANTRAMANLLQICERAKCEVSENEVDSVNIADLHDRKDFQYEFTRIDFEALCDDLFQEAMLIVEAAGKKTVLKPRQIHEIILVGGSSRIPKIQEMMQKKFRGRPISTSINPDEAIACGAAIVAAQVSGFHTSIRNNSLQVTDILGWSICIKDYWGKLIETIPRGTAIPTRYLQSWCTAYDNCTAVGFAVYQTKMHQGNQNRDEIEYLGHFDISGFPSKPKEDVKLMVYMDVDASGVLHVTAIEQATGIQNQVTFTRRVVD